MKPYIGIVHKDPKSAWGITFPDAPGCFSASDEIDDLFPNAAEALELWSEARVADGLPIPVPRELSELHADPKWRDRFDTATLVIAVQPPGPIKKAA